jgi:hypothetical protein
VKLEIVLGLIVPREFKSGIPLSPAQMPNTSDHECATLFGCPLVVVSAGCTRLEDWQREVDLMPGSIGEISV